MPVMAPGVVKRFRHDDIVGALAESAFSKVKTGLAPKFSLDVRRADDLARQFDGDARVDEVFPDHEVFVALLSAAKLRRADVQTAAHPAQHFLAERQSAFTRGFDRGCEERLGFVDIAAQQARSSKAFEIGAALPPNDVVRVLYCGVVIFCTDAVVGDEFVAARKLKTFHDALAAVMKEYLVEGARHGYAKSFAVVAKRLLVVAVQSQNFSLLGDPETKCFFRPSHPLQLLHFDVVTGRLKSLLQPAGLQVVEYTRPNQRKILQPMVLIVNLRFVRLFEKGGRAGAIIDHQF